ncbi:hypothetical protein GGI25_000687 [Coemansia spiralis]|uniref:WD40 repeat-like protein n=2 Tax=Coemansia TaxID=4863 RepID=A0A9W8GBB5_9FUNG|nr:hypothetical protein EDC05_000645 [Coemansia umbellata]KAJ2623685.1 hypothetical protein GGI26_002132 [Coemansia sp. RSA 1358]KAJ2680395.1 hypothetical protein GGI25_000687 [Coemansia spiralis]
MAYSLVAATSDTIRVWDFSSHTYKQHASQASLQSKRRGSFSESADNEFEQLTRVTEDAAFEAEKATGAIDKITSTSWAADGATFVAGGRGACIRQYSKSGEWLQDIKLTRRGERPAPMDIVAVQHYGINSESMFVANNTTKQVRRWDFIKKEYTSVCQTHEHNISCLAVCTKKRLVASATSQGGEIALFNLLHNTRTDLRSATQKALTCISISPGHRSQVCVGSEDGLLQLFDTTRTGAALPKTFPRVHAAPIRGLAFFQASSGTIVSAGLDSRIVVTDPRAYSNINAVTVASASPLTSLSCCTESTVIGTGTIDGCVLLYDIRAPSLPLWKSSVGSHKPVVSMHLMQLGADGTALDSRSSASALHRSASTSSANRRDEPRGMDHITMRNGHTSADDGHVSALYADRKRIRGSAASSTVATREGKIGLAPSSTQGSIGSDFRPPQHPSISRFRAAVNEHRLKATTNSSLRTTLASSLDSTSEFSKRSSPNMNEAAVFDDEVAEENTEAQAILAKDRSYMELLSPAKPKHSAYGSMRDDASASKRDDVILAMFSRNRPPATFVKSHKSPDKYAASENRQDKVQNTHDDDSYYTDEFEASPIPRPLNSRRTQEQHARSHDVGDSMMEMFTPERKKKGTPVQLLEEDAIGGGSSTGGLAQTLVAQLLNKQSEDSSGNKADATKLNLILERSPTNIREQDGAVHTPSQISDRMLHYKAQDLRESYSVQSNVDKEQHSTTTQQQHLQRLPWKRASTVDVPSAILSAESSASTKAETWAGSFDDEQQQQQRKQKQKQQLEANGDDAQTDPALAANAAVGPGSIGGNVLQNMLADALIPLRDQISNEIRNLHLDMIRQGFVYQEQINLLRKECSESNSLRQEVERLRQENEELKRYIPFYHAFDKENEACSFEIGSANQRGAQ